MESIEKDMSDDGETECLEIISTILPEVSSI